MYLVNNSSFDASEKYASLSLSSFPCHTYEQNVKCCSCDNKNCKDIAKHPLTANGCKDASTDKAERQRLFGGDYDQANIAIATGEVSGVDVLDVDDLADLSRLQKQYEPLPITWKVETGSGKLHFYFKHKPGLKNAVKVFGSLDYRTTDGYAIAPPSLHANGKRYKWLVPPDACDVAELPDWLFNLIPKQEQENSDEQRVQSTSPKSQVLTLRATTDEERLRAYLEQCPVAISGKGGMNETFRIVCYVVELFGNLTDDVIVCAMAEWNERCVPPWSDKELRRKLSDARKKTGRSVTPQATSDTPTLHADAYQGLIGELLTAIEPETETSPAAVLLSLLVAIGNAIGRTPTFTITGDKHHCNLFIVLVGNTSSGKGQAWGIANSFTKRIAPDWHNESLAYGLASGEGLIERLADEVQDKDEKQDSAAVHTVAEPKRILCIETEFAKPITAMRREGSTLSAVLRQAWDGQPLEVMTRGRSKLKVPNAHVSVLANVTPEELTTLLGKGTETTNGFANRFLWACVESVRDLPLGGNLNALEGFLDPFKQAIAYAQEVTTLTMSDDAETLWTELYPSLKRSRSAVTSRGRPQVLRLAMIYALLDKGNIIRTEHVQAAVAVWNYCEESALRLFNGSDLVFRLRSLVYEKPGLMRSELRQAVSHNIETATFDGALNWLLVRGDVVKVDVYEKRQAERYYPGLGITKTHHTPTTKEETSATASEPETWDLGDAGSTQKNNSNDYEQPVQYGQHENGKPKSPKSQAMQGNDVEQEPKSPKSQVQAATLGELFDWINAKGIRLTRNESGVVWLSIEDEQHLTPAIQAAIENNQQELLPLAVREVVRFNPFPEPTREQAVCNTLFFCAKGKVDTDAIGKRMYCELPASVDDATVAKWTLDNMQRFGVERRDFIEENADT